MMMACDIVPGVYEWSWFSEEKQIAFNGHFMAGDGDRVVIDPPPMTEADRAEIARRGGPTAIVLTNRDHVREIAACQRAYGVPVWVPAADAAWIDVPFDRTYDDASRLPGDLVAIRVPDAKSPGESALWSASKHVLIVGDAVIGKPSGALRLLPDEKFADPAKARAGLRVLLDPRYDYDAVLVGDGSSLPIGGRAALERLAAASRPA
jgi:glyoxylase-like metal-dependent hydrolase (beta-lactamase superfamily II)